VKLLSIIKSQNDIFLLFVYPVKNIFTTALSSKELVIFTLFIFYCCMDFAIYFHTDNLCIKSIVRFRKKDKLPMVWELVGINTKDGMTEGKRQGHRQTVLIHNLAYGYCV